MDIWIYIYRYIHIYLYIYMDITFKYWDFGLSFKKASLSPLFSVQS